MRRSFQALIAALLCCGAMAAGLPSAQQALVDSARLWEAQGRADLAHDALEKLLRARPSDPQAYVWIGLLELRSGRIKDAAARLSQLKKDYPQSPITQELADAYRLATTDRLRMASVRRLVEIGQNDDAVAGLKELFPDGPPQGELGMEYYRILGSRRQDWPQARAGMERLVREHPDDPQYQFELAGLLSQHDETRAQSLSLYAALSQRQDLKPLEFMDAWHSAIRRSSSGQTSAASLRDYLARAPDDKEAAARLAARERARQRLTALGLDTGNTDVLLRRADGLAAAQHWPAAEELYRKILLLEPDNGSASDGLARTLVEQGRTQEALDQLARQASAHPKRAHSSNFARARLLRARGDAEAAAGQIEAARVDLAAAIALTPDDPWLRYDLAKLELAQNNSSRGRELFEQGMTVAPQDPQMRYAFALYVSGLDAPQEALKLVDGIPPAQRSEGMRELDARLRQQLERAEVESLADAGRWIDAHQRYSDLAAAYPDDLGLQLAYARFLDHGNDAASTDVVLNQVDALAPRDDLDHRLESLRLRRSTANWPRAERASAALLAQAPNDPRVLRAAGQVAQAQGQNLQALAYYRRAADTAPANDPDRAEIERLLASAQRDRIDDARGRLAYVATSMDLQEKPGDPGISHFRDLEVPVELRWPLNPKSYVWAHLDTARIESGTLPADYNSAALYGKVQAYGPGSLAQFPNGAEQSQTGESLAVGYHSDRYRLDLGTTPLGFLVQDVVGSAEVDGSAGPLDWFAGLSRRPVNSSYLSYGGARDPVTGEIWGGVRKSSLSLGIGHYASRWGANASAGYSLLNGRNTESNQELSARAYAYRILYSSDNTELSLGLSATHWAYDKNLRFYTFGQGGYYSPQSYISLGVPVNLEGRWGRLAYQLRGSVSHSNSSEDDSPFYPHNPELQQLALHSPLPSGYSRPVYDGGSGSGIGYDIRSILEYKLSRRWFVGSRFEIDRSAFYAPNYYTLYLRYEFRPHDWAIDFPPRPIIPYSQY